MGERRKTAIYLRISTEDMHFKENYQGQEESFSISHQRAYLQEYIRKDKRLSGSEVVEFYDDGFMQVRPPRVLCLAHTVPP